MPSTVAEWIVAIIGAGGGLKFLSDLLTARSQSRKNKTDNAVTLINSATGYAEGLVRRLDQQEADFAAFKAAQEARNRAQEARNRAEDRLRLAHAQWDYGVVVELRARDIQVADPPPLFLPDNEETAP